MFTCHERIRTTIGGLRGYGLLALMCTLIVAGCDPKKPEVEYASAEKYFPIAIGENTLQLQLALTPIEQRKGLMYRKELPENHGMLFLFERPNYQSFWMKNTSIPLDIGYFEPGGQLIEVYPLFPFDETHVSSRNSQILIAVETNRGWYAEHGVKPGAQLDMEALKAAIKQRGFDPDQYALED